MNTKYTALNQSALGNSRQFNCVNPESPEPLGVVIFVVPSVLVVTIFTTGTPFTVKLKRPTLAAALGLEIYFVAVPPDDNTDFPVP